MLSVYVNGDRVEYTNLSFSSVDPGGFESCSFASKKELIYSPGDDVRVFEGSSTAWHGRIEEPGLEYEFGRAANQINAVGYGADMRREPFAMIFVDGDMSNFATVSNERRRALLLANYQPADMSVELSNFGLPALRLQVNDTWISPTLPICEAVWHAGPHTTIRRAYWDWQTGPHVNSVDANWHASAYVWDEETALSFAVNSNFSFGAGSGKSATIHYLFGQSSVMFNWFYGSAPAGTTGYFFDLNISNFKVFGDHDLPIQNEINLVGTTVYGLRLSDIVAEVMRRSKTGFELDVEANNLLVTQFSYREPTDSEAMIIDAARLAGWHWGVWEPNLMSSTPVFRFRPPPKSATTSVSVSDCDKIDVTESLSALYNEIYLTYTDGFGKQKFTIYRNDHPRIRPGETRRLVINGGVLHSDAAPAYARYLLLLTQADSRVAGSCELPTRMYDGRWAHLIRPGLDKIQIFGLGRGQVLGNTNSRFDTFRIRRVSVSAAENGTPRTTVEFDRGADLIEVLQARMSQANSAIGF